MADTQGFARDVRAAMRWVAELADRAESDVELGKWVAVEETDPSFKERLEDAFALLLSVDIDCTALGWIEDPDQVSP